MKCYICNIIVDYFHMVWLPERMKQNNQVYPICFDCCDSFLRCYNQHFVPVLRRRELGLHTKLH